MAMAKQIRQLSAQQTRIETKLDRVIELLTVLTTPVEVPPAEAPLVPPPQPTVTRPPATVNTAKMTKAPKAN